MAEIDSSRRKEITGDLPPRQDRPFGCTDLITITEQGGKRFQFRGHKVADIGNDYQVIMTNGRIWKFQDPTIQVGSREHPTIDPLLDF